MQHRHYALALLGLMCAFGVSVWEKERALKLEMQERIQVATLLSTYSGGSAALDSPRKTSPCFVHDALPDTDCTPGAVFPDADLAAICQPGYTKNVRSVSIGLKHEIYDAYGFAYPQPRGSFELDHLIPLELGGSNDRGNLWPEAKIAPGFPEKDLVENYLHEEACAGDVDLSEAQKQIAVNWLAVYHALSQETIARLKKQYTSWAN